MKTFDIGDKVSIYREGEAGHYKGLTVVSVKVQHVDEKINAFQPKQYHLHTYQVVKAACGYKTWEGPAKFFFKDDAVIEDGKRARC